MTLRTAALLILVLLRSPVDRHSLGQCHCDRRVASLVLSGISSHLLEPQAVSLLDGLEITHEFAVEIVFDSKRQGAAEMDPPFVEYPGAVSQVENQKILTAGHECPKSGSFEPSHQIVINDRILPHGVYADFVER